jgi:hypothetical protein
MRKVQVTAVFWTMLLAIPLTALALSLLAYVTENLTQIYTSLVTFSRDISAGGRGVILETAQRWPEIAGMIIGQVVILLILLIARKNGKEEQTSANR